MEVNNQAFDKGQIEGMVTVIVPCFNSQDYLRETIDSLLIQLYHQWECILVDDGSTDDTLTQVQNYTEKYPERFRFYKNPGKGACAARNYGMDQAKGEYIKFLDSDDALFDETVLTEQIKFLKDTNSDIVYGNEIYYKDSFDEFNFRKQRGKELNNVNIHTQFFNRFPITSNFLYKVPKGPKIRWNQELKSGQEFHFLFTSYLNGLVFNYQNKSIAKIRIHNSVNRITNKKPKVYADQTNQLIAQMTEDIEKYDIHNKELLTSFNLWKLRWSYFAYNAKNHKVFKEIQRGLAPLETLNITNSKQNFLYKLNTLSSITAFLYYRFHLKVLKKSIL
jgi:glycosyltransferase involved in cell wall biosynthesis